MRQGEDSAWRGREGRSAGGGADGADGAVEERLPLAFLLHRPRAPEGVGAVPVLDHIADETRGPEVEPDHGSDDLDHADAARGRPCFGRVGGKKAHPLETRIDRRSRLPVGGRLVAEDRPGELQKLGSANLGDEREVVGRGVLAGRGGRLGLKGKEGATRSDFPGRGFGLPGFGEPPAQ